MNKNVSLRITLDVMVFVSILFGWWFAAIPFGLIGAWVFPRYLEIVIAGFLHDALYGIGRGLGIFGYAYVICAVVFLGLISYLKVFAKNNS